MYVKHYYHDDITVTLTSSRTFQFNMVTWWDHRSLHKAELDQRPTDYRKPVQIATVLVGGIFSVFPEIQKCLLKTAASQVSQETSFSCQRIKLDEQP